MLNPLLCTDVYKMGHMEQYPRGTSRIYSYLHSRSNIKYKELVLFGLQGLLKQYLCNPITLEMVAEFLEYRGQILGKDAPEAIKKQLYSLVDLGYIPLKIKSFPEGTILPGKSVIATMTNTEPYFHWVVGFFESLLLHIWNPITVASASRQYYNLVKSYGEKTCDDLSHIPFSVHDFGYRGVSSNESAMTAGAAHLIHFKGTDTVLALKYIKDYYHSLQDELIGCSVPASEHSVMAAFGKDNELEAFENMLTLYPEGIVSIVSDTYDIYNAVTNIAGKLKDKILSRNGKVVFRPDSGVPLEILCGDVYSSNSKAVLGVFDLLECVFGSNKNKKGYKLLPPQIGVIYGDGMTYNNFADILATMDKKGWASSNLVIGVGGILLQNHSRDEFGFSFKATYAEIDNMPVNIFKDPITDIHKKSLTGLISCRKDENGNYVFLDKQTWQQESESLLETIYWNGKIIFENTIESIRNKALKNDYKKN